MTIEIHRPELEALITERMKSGGFEDIEDGCYDASHAGSQNLRRFRRKTRPWAPTLLQRRRSRPSARLTFNHHGHLFPCMIDNRAFLPRADG